MGSIAVDPRDSQSIFLFGGPRFGPGPHNQNAGVFASQNGGGTWVKMTGCGYPVWNLQFVAVGVEYWLYAATMDSLRYLKTIPDDPTTPWEYGDGISGVAPVDAFARASSGRPS